jgi:CRISPR-associated protein Cas1
MEPYRPYVDSIVLEIIKNERDYSDLTISIKKKLLEIPAIDIQIAGEKSPLMVGLQRSTVSLVKCFEGSSKKLIYPKMD